MTRTDWIQVAVAAGTLALATAAFFQLWETSKSRRLQADSLRRILVAEIERLVKPYRDQLMEWGGQGYKTFPTGTVFEGTSTLLQQNVGLLHLLAAEEQQLVTDFMLLLAEVYPANKDRFQPYQRDELAGLATAADLARVELMKKGNIGRAG